MQRIDTEEVVYMIKIETESERVAYELTELGAVEKSIWNTMIWAIGEKGVKNDEDIVYYFLPSEQIPQIGDKFDLDKMVWERIQ